MITRPYTRPNGLKNHTLYQTKWFENHTLYQTKWLENHFLYQTKWLENHTLFSGTYPYVSPVNVIPTVNVILFLTVNVTLFNRKCNISDQP